MLLGLRLRQAFPPPVIRNGRRHSVTRQMIFQISGEVLKRIDRVVGFRPVTKAGIRGVVNLVKSSFLSHSFNHRRPVSPR
jgi:hypothetical protein